MTRSRSTIVFLVLALGVAALASAPASAAGNEPDSSVSSPTDNATIPSPAAITGSATDDDGVSRVRVAIRNTATGDWLRADGSFGSFTQLDTTLSNPGALSTSWSFSAALPAGSYGVSVRAVDSTGVVETTRPWVLFTVGSTGVNTEPNTEVAAPTAGAALSRPGTIHGTATDDSGVTQVRVGIRNRSTGRWLQADGVTFGAQFVQHQTHLLDPGAATTAWTLLADLPTGSYGLTARATDDQGLVETTRPWVTFTMAESAHTPITFRAIADVPYSAFELTQLQQTIPNIRADEEFLIHLGDLKSSADKACGDSYYSSMFNVLLTSPVPAHIILGDNEWNDCDDPPAAFARWMSYFADIEDNFSGPPVARQSVRPENFAFVDGDTLFIGINLVGGQVLNQADWDQRYADNAAWIAEQLDTDGVNTSSAVVFGHMLPVPEIIDPMALYAKPVLYMMGDIHLWTEFMPAAVRAPNVRGLILDRGVPGASITATHDPLNPWLFDQTP